MAVTTTFTVKNNLTVDTTNHVLVFLKPVKASPNFQYLAWRDLRRALHGSKMRQTLGLPDEARIAHAQASGRRGDG